MLYNGRMGKPIHIIDAVYEERNTVECRNCGEVEYLNKAGRKVCAIARRQQRYFTPSGERRNYVGQKKSSKGYIKIFDGERWTSEQRNVMENMIGRKLLSSETVHHKNGVRSDNRPENLELWSKAQPSGQRVKDKLAWAKEIIKLYGDIETNH